MTLDNIIGIERVFRFAAQHGRWHAPRTILPGFAEIEVITAGYGDFRINDGAPVNAGPGSMIRLQAGDVLAVTADAVEPYCCIVFEFSVTEAAPAPVPHHTVWQDTTQCIDFCQTAFEHFHGGEVEHEVFCAYHYSRLAWEAQRYLRTASALALPHSVLCAREYLRQHFHQPLSIERLAEVAGVSASHLHLLYRRHLGVSPIQQLVQTRLAKARELLVSSDRSVKEISHSIGFNNVAHFCRIFKARLGMSPTDYRHRFEYPTRMRTLERE